MLQNSTRKDVYVKDVYPGRQYKKAVFGLKDFRRLSGGAQIGCVLYDKTGSIPASMPAASLEQVPGDGVYQVDFNVTLVDGKMHAGISHVEPGKASPVEIFGGLGADRVSYYKDLIEKAVNYVCTQDSSGVYSTILKAYLTKQRLSELALRPASGSSFGLYAGGALAATASLTVLAKDVAVEHMRCSNGLYQEKLDMVLIVTATLLSMCGIFAYVDDAMNKTPVGFHMGYYALCQRAVDRICLEQAVPLTDERVSLLLNVLQCMVSSRTGMKNVSREGMLCRNVFFMYREMDQMERALAEDLSGTDGVLYSKWLNRYLIKNEKGETEDAQ